MPGADNGRPQDARLDEHDRAHMALRNPVLPLGHLAHQALVRMRFVVRRVAPLEVAQPKDDKRYGGNQTKQSEEHGSRHWPKDLSKPKRIAETQNFQDMARQADKRDQQESRGEHIPYDQQPVTEEKRD